MCCTVCFLRTPDTGRHAGGFSQRKERREWSEVLRVFRSVVNEWGLFFF